MLRLPEMYLSEDDSKELFEKLEVYNKKHPDDTITAMELAKLFLEYGVRYLDVTALD